MRSNVPNEHLLHVLPLQRDDSPDAAGKRHRQHSVDQFEEPIPESAGLRDDQGGDSQLHGWPGTNGGQAGHSGKLCGSRSDLDAAYSSTMPDEEVRTFGENTPLGRAGQPAELAPAYVLLASAEASYMTGAMIPVTGGRPML